MTEIETQPRYGFVAVVFAKFNTANQNFEYGEKPYFYLDPHGLEVGDHGLVHNGSNFGIVRVARRIDDPSATVFTQVQKPVMAKIDIDHELVGRCNVKLMEFRAKSLDARIQSAIDRALASDVPVSRPGKRKTKSLEWIDDVEDDY